jgi:hypothetical protein
VRGTAKIIVKEQHVGNYQGKGIPSFILFFFLTMSMVTKACLWRYILVISVVPKPCNATGLEGGLIISWVLLAMVVLVGPQQRSPKERETSLKCSMNVGNSP